MATRDSSEGTSGISGWVAFFILAIGATLLVATCRPTPTPTAKPPAPSDTNGPRDVKPPENGSAQPGVALSGRELYARHCAACHGDNGDGKGIAASFLYPKPRDFRAGKFRLVSTTNGVPTREDLDAVLVRGMPGSSMPPWAHLNTEDRSALTDEVLRMYHEGMREQYVALLKKEEGLTDEEIAEDEEIQTEIAEFVERRTTPGPSSEVPAITQPDEAAIARGKAIYIKQSCNSCHGDEGRGDGAKEQFDDEGYPTRPRDYTRGIFKGGHDVASVYRRVAYGMPGTPMPSSTNITPDQIVDMVHFLISLSDEETRQAAIMRREKIIVKRLDTMPTASDDAVWADVQPVKISVSPLWWRDHDDPQLQIQAAHDGTTIAIRLSWQDVTQNQSSVRPQDFDDMVAVQLFRGPHEPFLGMGARDGSVDVWLWKASWLADRTELAGVDTQYPNMVIDMYPFEAEGDDRRPHATERQAKDYLTGWMAGNALSDPNREITAGNLQATGFGTLSMMPRVSQSVSAEGTWSGDRWSVVLRRSLAASGSDGLTLSSGDKLSVAFAIWDGEAHDRDGQKMVSIWQDLSLE